MHHAEMILILDFGSQTTQLIARRIRELHVYCEIHPYDRAAEAIARLRPRGIVLSGGPSSVYDDEAPTVAPEVFSAGVPVLGICYGMQALVHQTGGRIEASLAREYGQAHIEITGEFVGTGIFARLDASAPQKVWMSHGDRLLDPGPGFIVSAVSTHGIAAAVAHREHPWYGVQFHPEVFHSPSGPALLDAFVHGQCGCAPTWTPASFVEQVTAEIRDRVAGRTVICGLSGGVDSSVAAALVHRAIGDKLQCIFVDNGLLRKGEAERVRAVFAEHFHMNVDFVDASAEFLAALAGVEEPEQKRKIIGRIFVDVFQREAQQFADAHFLCQGTLYPDVIESVSFKGPSHTIKSHHNVGGLPDTLHLELLEPLRELFKDEARAVGTALGLPDHVVHRQPFPGPGLAVRILGEVTSERCAVLREADAIVTEELEQRERWPEIWQSFAVLLPVRTVGVMGDKRTYENVCAIRAVSSTDGMTAEPYPIPHHVLSALSTRIINEVHGINRVVYDISSKPPATIEWE